MLFMHSILTFTHSNKSNNDFESTWFKLDSVFENDR